MVIEAIVGAFLGVIGLFVGLLPEASGVNHFEDLSGWMGGLMQFNDVFPVVEAIACLSAYVAIRMTAIAAKVVYRIRSLLPFV